jgi:uncharacterized protein (DUF58 family)
MRAALSGLTTRGRSFLAAGLAACACGLLLGEQDLLRVGVFLCALPLFTAAVVSRTRYRLSCDRRLVPQRVSVGDSARVVLRLENLSRVPTGVLLLEDRLPYSLGGRPRFVVNRIEPHGIREVSYLVRSDVRGRYPIGPLSLRFADLFGLVEVTRSFTATEALVVTPSVVPLPSVQLGGDWSGSGDSQSRSIALTGEDDVTTREYRHGDDLRRVHWRSTARYGELMVRREEQPRQHRGVLFLDTRQFAHRGDGPGSSFEWAVTAAASIGSRLSRDGFGVRFVTDAGEEVAGQESHAGIGVPFEGLLLDTLAIVTFSAATDLTHGLSVARRTEGEGIFVAIVGALSEADIEAMTRLRHHGARRVAVALDIAQWSSAVDARDAERYVQARRLLEAAGWQVLLAGPRSDVRSLWTHAGSNGRFASGPAVLAAMQPGVGATAPGVLGATS